VSRVVIHLRGGSGSIMKRALVHCSKRLGYEQHEPKAEYNPEDAGNSAPSHSSI
jgi:hypothetical protein